jgi:hypothetical protein
MQPVYNQVDIQIFYQLFEQDNGLSYYMELFLDSRWDMLDNINDLLCEEVYQRTKT